MRFTLEILAAISIAQGVASQDCNAGWPCSTSAAAVPSCAVPCIQSAAVSKAGCTNVNDYGCRCSASAVIQDAALNCVVGGCGIATALQVLPAVSALCKCVTASPTTSCAPPAPTSVSEPVTTTGPAPSTTTDVTTGKSSDDSTSKTNQVTSPPTTATTTKTPDTSSSSVSSSAATTTASSASSASRSATSKPSGSGSGSTGSGGSSTTKPPTTPITAGAPATYGAGIAGCVFGIAAWLLAAMV